MRLDMHRTCIDEQKLQALRASTVSRLDQCSSPVLQELLVLKLSYVFLHQLHESEPCSITAVLSLHNCCGKIGQFSISNGVSYNHTTHMLLNAHSGFVCRVELSAVASPTHPSLYSSCS